MKQSFPTGEFRPATLGTTLAAGLRLIVWCKACRYQAEPDVGEQVARYGEAMTLMDWSARLVCSRCGSRDADCVVSGYKGGHED